MVAKLFPFNLALVVFSVYLCTSERATAQGDSVRWVTKSSSTDFSKLPPGAIESGIPFYITRAFYGGGQLPGKFAPNGYFRSEMMFAYNGEELKRSDFEVLEYTQGDLIWLNASDVGASTKKPFKAGTHLTTKQPLYVCRVQHDSRNLVIGYLATDSTSCVYPFYQGRQSSQYEVLVDNRETPVVNQPLISCKPQAGEGLFRCMLSLFVQVEKE